ncbi:MAG: PadR family transcriptional regulator [Saprospiraceae bacterium]
MVNYDNAIAQMKKGVLDMCILSILAAREAYPSDIIQTLRHSDLIVVEGTLYPLLNRLKNAGLLDYSWRESTSGPPRKYYRITEEGQHFLKELHSSWTNFVSNVNQSLNFSQTNN